MNEINNPEKFIAQLIKTYYSFNKNSKISYEDLYQAGYLGYLKAKDNYNIEAANGNPMSKTYAKWYIRQDINKFLKSELSQGNPEHLVNINEEEEDLIQNTNDARAKEKVKSMLGILNSRERMVIRRRYLTKQATPLSELGKLLGVTRQRVMQIQFAAIKKLKEAFKE